MAVDWAGDHGEDVPVGVVAKFTCKEGFDFADASTTMFSSTCRSDGWTALPEADVCGECEINGCSTCPGLQDCDACRDGKVLTRQGGEGKLALDTSMVSFDLDKMRLVGGDSIGGGGGNYRYGTAEDSKKCTFNRDNLPINK